MARKKHPSADQKKRFTVEVSEDHISIRCNGHLYLRLFRGLFVAFQAWKKGRLYKIEYSLTDAEAVLTEYTRKEDWQSILDQLEDNGLPRPRDKK